MPRIVTTCAQQCAGTLTLLVLGLCLVLLATADAATNPLTPPAVGQTSRSGFTTADGVAHRAAPIHCQPGAVPTQYCPGGVPCPPSGQCPVGPLARSTCTDIKSNAIIGEGQIEYHHAEDAGSCCDRCLATKDCECWTFKTE
eukprot:SAG11_NODE_10750_length_809_cov_0.834979_1_plen_141_part_10